MTAPRILVTGAAGFVGTCLRAALLRRTPAPVVIGTGLSHEGVLALDLTDAAAVDALLARERPDVIVHLAAQASIGALQEGAEPRTWAVNLGGTLNLALAMARHVPEATILFASSSEVYGHAFRASPVDESVAPEPANVYARSKLLAEQVLAQALPASARLLVARPFNHTGAGQREDFVLPSFAGQVARIEAGLQPPLMHVGNLDAARDFLDVRDVVAAYEALIDAAPRLPHRFTCNVASGRARTLRNLLEIFRGLARVPFAIEVDPARLRLLDIPVASGCADRLRDVTGWHPTIPFEDTLASLLTASREVIEANAERGKLPARAFPQD